MNGFDQEARALLGRLEFQRGNFDAALQVFQGIDIKALSPRMTGAIVERTRLRKPRAKGDNIPPGVMSMHSVSLLLEAILLKAKSLEELGQYIGMNPFCFLSQLKLSAYMIIRREFSTLVRIFGMHWYLFAV